MEEWFAQIVAFLEWLSHLAGHYSALTLLGITQAGQMPIVGALANFMTLFCGVVLVLQLARVIQGDSKVLQRIDERTAAIEKRYASELAGKDEEIAALHTALAAVRTSVVDGTERPATVEQALAEFQRTGDPTKVEAVLADIEAQAMRTASPHLKEAAAAARHLGALASLRSVEDALAAYRRAAELDPNDTWTWIFISRLERAAGRLPAAETAANAALDCARQEASVRNDNAALMELGNLAVIAGQLPDAVRHFEAIRPLFEEQAAADPGNAEWQRDLSVSWDRIGDVRVAQGDLAAALEAYEAAKAIRDKLAAADPGNAGWQRDLSVSWNKIGDVRRAQGDLAGALDAYGADKAIAEKLAAADPGNAGWQRDLSVSWEKIGDVRTAQGDLAGALDAHTARHAIAEKLAAADPDNAEWQRDLSVSWNKIGDVRRAQGDLAGALDAYEAGKAIRDKLAAADPGNAGWQRDLSVSWNKIGDVQRAQGDLTSALAAYEASKAIFEKLAAADPGNAGWQRNLSISWERLAGIHERQDERAAATAAWREALTISETLAARFPDSVDLQTTPVVHLAGLARLADVTTADGRASARGYLERALALLQPLAAAGKLDAQRAGWVDWIESELAKLEP